MDCTRWNKTEEKLLLELISSRENWETISNKLHKTVAACKQKVKRIRASNKKVDSNKVTATISFNDNIYTLKIDEHKLKSFIIQNI